jgi:hypothetical protein
MKLKDLPDTPIEDLFAHLARKCFQVVVYSSPGSMWTVSLRKKKIHISEQQPESSLREALMKAVYKIEKDQFV